MNLVNIEKDALGISKPITKLIDVLANGCYYLVKPYLDKMQAKADREIEKDNLLHQMEMQRVIEQDKGNIRVEREVSNTISIVSQCAENLDSSINVNDEPVDPDWAAIFFDYAKNISRKEAQAVWAKVLQGEIEKPGSFSLKTLEVLRSMGKQDAEDFLKLAQHILYGELIVIDHSGEKVECLVDYDEINRALSLGLICPVEIIKTVAFVADGLVSTIPIGSSELSIIPVLDIELTLEGYNLSQAGIELFSITSPVVDKKILELYKNYLCEKMHDAIISYE